MKNPEFAEKYTRIIPYDMIPPVSPLEDQKEVVGAITAHTELTFDEQVVDVGPEVLAVNALLLKRDQLPLRSEELQKSIGVDQLTEAFARQLGSVATKLLAATGAELVEVNGPTRDSMTYRLSPQVRLVDHRNKPKEDPLTFTRNYAKNRLMNAAEVNAKTYDSIRKTILTTLVREYSNHDRVRPALNRLYLDNAPAIQKRYLDYEDWPKKDECDYYLSQIEAGLAAVLGEKDDAGAQEAVFKMIVAYHSLYYRHVYLIHGLARKFMNIRSPYEDLFQAGSVALMEFIMGYSSQKEEGTDNLESTFTSDALYALGKQMSHFNVFEHTSRLPSRIRERQRNIQQATELFIQEQRRHPTFEQIAQMLGLTKKQVIEAVSDHRAYEDAANGNDGFFDRSIESFSQEEEIRYLLQEDILTEREKIIISLHYGIFASHLGGATVTSGTNGHGTFIYPHSEEMMPQSTAMSALQMSKLLGVGTSAISSILYKGLKKCRDILGKKGIKSLDEL
jgi:RNA polymerase sigma factor (sigma-70 family)